MIDKAAVNYSQMSDPEINIAVAKKLGHELTSFELPNHGRVLCIKSLLGDDWLPERIPDYCNSWDDIGPIIESNKIAIQSKAVDACWWAMDQASEDVMVIDKNPKRAAAIVFLMMEKEQ